MKNALVAVSCGWECSRRPGMEKFGGLLFSGNKRCRTSCHASRMNLRAGRCSAPELGDRMHWSRCVVDWRRASGFARRPRLLEIFWGE